jgi:zinc protease
LPNGGKYALLEKPAKGDKIIASITLRFGDENSLTNKSTTGVLLAEMLKTGTTTKTKKQIADELDRIKTNISFNGGAGSLSIGINTDKQNLAAALALLDDMLKHPAFDATEFDKVILDTKAGIESGKSDPQTLASEKLANLTSGYPKGHPLYASTTDEDLEDLASLKLEEVKKYYNDFYGADNSISVFVGQLDKKQITDFLQHVFGTWNSKEPYKDIERKYFETKKATETINTPDKTNAIMLAGMNLNISRKHPDYPAIHYGERIARGRCFFILPYSQTFTGK